MESLRETQNTKRELEAFSQATMGTRIADYLKEEAWKDDLKHNTKVYLIRDMISGEIAFYFSLNCGILFEELNAFHLSDEEKEPFDQYVKALQYIRENEDQMDQDNANKQLDEAMMKFETYRFLQVEFYRNKYI